MDLEQRVRQTLQEKTSAIIREEKKAIAKIKKECYSQCTEAHDFHYKEAFFTHMVRNWFTLETLSNICQFIYTATPEEINSMYLAQETQQELNEENEAAYQNLQKRTEEFQEKVKNVAKRVEENKLESQLDAMLYPLIRNEFRDKHEYIQFFTTFYTTYFHAFKPQLDASKIFFRAVMKARRVITTKEASLIFEREN